MTHVVWMFSYYKQHGLTHVESCRLYTYIFLITDSLALGHSHFVITLYSYSVLWRFIYKHNISLLITLCANNCRKFNLLSIRDHNQRLLKWEDFVSWNPLAVDVVGITGLSDISRRFMFRVFLFSDRTSALDHIIIGGENCCYKGLKLILKDIVVLVYLMKNTKYRSLDKEKNASFYLSL